MKEINNLIIYDSVLEIEKLRALKNGSGEWGKCYFLTPDTLLKKFFHQYENVGYQDYDFDFMLGLKSETYVFPQKLVYVGENREFIGYTMRYEKGSLLRDSKNKLSFNQLINFIPQIEKDTKEISEKKIINADLHNENIIINNKFRIIDTDCFTERKGLSSKKCLTDNMANIYELILDTVIQNKPIIELFIYLNSNRMKNMYESAKEGKNLCMQKFLYEFRSEVSKLAGYDIHTIGQLQNTFENVNNNKLSRYVFGKK